jgi:predicted esterase YcpF (UPF0227 family)
MKKVLYLHGLESKQGGPKVDFLTKEFCVYAPEMDYKDPMLQNWVYFVMRQFNPDLIIGSSMGGYIADILAEKYGNHLSYSTQLFTIVVLNLLLSIQLRVSKLNFKRKK